MGCPYLLFLICLAEAITETRDGNRKTRNDDSRSRSNDRETRNSDKTWIESLNGSPASVPVNDTQSSCQREGGTLATGFWRPPSLLTGRLEIRAQSCWVAAPVSILCRRRRSGIGLQRSFDSRCWQNISQAISPCYPEPTASVFRLLT